MSNPDDVLTQLQKAGVVRASRPGRTKPSAVLPIRSLMINPYSRFFSHRKNIIEPQRRVSYRTLRRVAEKAWLINTIIGHQANKVRPFLSPSPDENVRGFQILLKDDEKKPGQGDRETIKYLERFIQDCGEPDPDRDDDLVKHSGKLVRDLLTIDQVATEIQRTRAQKPYAFWSVDPATIFKVTEEGYEGDDKIRYVQEVEMQVTATYTAADLLFDYQNPRSDIDFAAYGYSLTEQAIDLITALINAFVFNAGAFTEDKLPRGMLLLNGDADLEDVEAMEEFIISVMSGGPGSKWRIPIVPANAEGGKEKSLEWISLQKTNAEMQFAQWTEFLWTSTAALFGVDLEELGIRTQKSTTLLGENVEPRIMESKSRGLGAILSFMQNHLQRIVDMIDDRFALKFVGFEKDDVKLRNETMEAELRSYKSVDMLCAENDVKPYNEPWSRIPLNTNVVQLVQSMMGMQGGNGGGGTPAGEEEEGGAGRPRSPSDRGFEQRDAGSEPGPGGATGDNSGRQSRGQEGPSETRKSRDEVIEIIV